MLNVNLEEFGQVANWSMLPKSIADLDIQSTALDAEFPGAILPAVAINGRVYWYAATKTSTDWRVLAPLLVAYVGPTLTDFCGVPLGSKANKPPEVFLRASGAGALGRIIAPVGQVEVVGKGLRRLRQAFLAHPRQPQGFEVSTSVVLNKLDFCIANGDRYGAQCQVAFLRENWRLDPVNLLFLQVRVFGAFRDWTCLFAQPWFDDICVVRKPTAVAVTLLHCIWNVFLDGVSEDSGQLLLEYQSHCRSKVLSLLPGLSETDDEIVSKFRRLEGESSGRETLAVTATISKEPSDWLDWLSSVDDQGLADPIERARHGANMWPVWKDSDRLLQLASRLLDERTTARGKLLAREVLPCLLLWAKRDEDYPRRAAESLYSAIFARLVLLEGREAPEREAIADLYDALLELGVSSADYKQLAQDMVSLVAEAPGRSTLDWLLDLASITLRHPAPDVESRRMILNGILSSLQSARSILSEVHRATYDVLAVMGGWQPLPKKLESTSSSRTFASLAGKTIAIYTLTEAVARQAKEILLRLQPDVRVECVHDHVASTRLENLSKNADLMVVVWASAKHAATECIQKNRKGSPVTFAAGRGVSSLVRAITDYQW